MRLLAQAAKKHGDLEDADRYLASVDAIDDDTDPLVASRVYSFYGGYHRAFDDRLGQPTALEMAVAIAEGTPSKELAMALATLSTSTDGSRSIDSSLALARRAVDVAVAADAGVEEAYARWALVTRCGILVNAVRL